MESIEYSKFKFLKENRPISDKKVNEIMLKIKTYGYIKGKDVLVNEEYGIIDGQNRFEACKRLKIPVPFEVVKGDFTAIMMALNEDQTSWKIIDYINSWSVQRIDCYRKFLKFEEKYNLGVSSSIELFFQSTGSSTAIGIRKGKQFKINEKAEAVAEYLLTLKDVPYYKTQSFCRSVYILYNKVSSDQREIIRLNVLSIPQCSKIEQYLNAFENILNRNKRSKIKL